MLDKIQTLMPTITLIIAVSGFLFSIINWIVRRAVTNKIRENEIKHIDDNIKKLEAENKEYKKEQDSFHEKIYRRLGKIEKAIVKREAICELRHKND
jgi:hypothetical protein